MRRRTVYEGVGRVGYTLSSNMKSDRLLLAFLIPLVRREIRRPDGEDDPWFEYVSRSDYKCPICRN